MTSQQTQLVDQVLTNLKHFHLWTELSVVDVKVAKLVVGTPPDKIHPEDEPKSIEYVLPSTTEQNWTIRQWDQVFKALEEVLGAKPKRITMAMVTNDGTIVYYFINSGLAKPRKN